MLKFQEFLNEELNFDVNINKPLYFEFGEGSIILNRNSMSHIREKFARTINDVYGKNKNPDGVNNKVPIKPEHIVDDILFALPKIVSKLVSGRVEVTRACRKFATKDFCLDIDPTYSPDKNQIRLQIKNLATGLNTLIAFKYFKSNNDFDCVGLTGITVIWKWDFKSPCLRKDNIIEIYNDNISQYYDQYPLQKSLDSYVKKDVGGFNKKKK
jgi:hypothetical protein